MDSLERSLRQRSDSGLVDLHETWIGGELPASRAARIQALAARMQNPAAVAAVRALLEEAEDRLFEMLLQEREGLLLPEIKERAPALGLKTGQVRGTLARLESLGLAYSRNARRGSQGRSHWTVPREMAGALLRASAAPADPAPLLTLRGFLERHFRHQGEEAEAAALQARRMYRFLASEKAVVQRIQGLSAELRALVDRAATEYGGLVPLEELPRLGVDRGELPRLGLALEEESLGTVGELDLERFGIRQRGPVLALFNEVVLAWLRQRAREQPVEPAEVASLGVDFVSNFSRFASFVGDQTVRFTVRGTIFKSTGKRIAESLIPNPGKEFRRREILDLLYRFALAWRLIDRSGERAFLLTPAGQEFLKQPLAEKQRRMLDWLVEDRTLPGDLSHQLRLRRITLRYLKRLEPGIWYDAMFLPFVARNHYLAGLPAEVESHGETGSFPVRSSADLRSLAWNLFTWIRKHAYLLGIVDMGYDDSGRACAIRLTPLGAELLEMIPGRELEGAGHVVVNPDFEVVLFPEEQSHELIYTLDRFCERELTDSLYHYRITPESLHRALAEGMTLDAILELLQRLSRTPLPQNVVYSLESWARNEGLVTFQPEERCLTCEKPEILDRLERHPELDKRGLEREDPATLRIRQPVDTEELADWVRDFGIALRIAG